MHTYMNRQYQIVNMESQKRYGSHVLLLSWQVSANQSDARLVNGYLCATSAKTPDCHASSDAVLLTIN